MAKRVMRKYFLMLIALMLTGHTMFSQVLLIPEVQSNGIVLRQQLWSVMINNLSGQSKKAVLTVSVVDQTTSQPLLEASSGMILLNAGVKRVMYNDLSPVTDHISSAGFGMDRQLNQPLPVGEYIICYKLTEADNKNEVLGNECVKVIAEPLSPPQLILPENEAVIMEPRPVLTWTPPAPVNMFSSLSYDIIVSPLYDKQSPQEALQRNLPVMTTISANNSILYPSSFTNLQGGKTYVWQVAAEDAGRPGGKSEVFTFTVMPDSVAKIISMAPYIKLDMNNPQVTIMHQGVLKMEYFNACADSTVKVEAYLLSEKEVKGKKQITFDLPVKPGQNFLEYRLGNKIRLDESVFYGIRLSNSRGEEWFMKFNPKYYF